MKFLIVAALLFQLTAAAQSSKIRFRTVNQGGLIYGDSDPSWAVQSVNGLAYKTFSAGIGAGIDAYYFRSVPLFIDLRKDFFDKWQTPFVYLDLGTNIPVNQRDSTYWETSSFNGGFYYDFGIGYSWALRSRFHFLISLGYTEKRVEEIRTTRWWWNNERSPDDYDFTFRRVSLKLGLRF